MAGGWNKKVFQVFQPKPFYDSYKVKNKDPSSISDVDFSCLTMLPKDQFHTSLNFLQKRQLRHPAEKLQRFHFFNSILKLDEASVVVMVWN